MTGGLFLYAASTKLPVRFLSRWDQVLLAYAVAMFVASLFLFGSVWEA